MSFFRNNLRAEDYLFIHEYALGDAGIEPLRQAGHSLMLSKGYKLKSGEPGNGIYEKGTQLMNILFGAFAMHYEPRVSFQQVKTEDGTLLPKAELHYMGDGAKIWGGLWGIKKTKDELKAMLAAFQGI